MATFSVPSRADVSANNQNIFDNLQKGLGFVPNLYAYFAKNDTALGDYLTLQNRKNTLSPKEREIINLVVSQVNECEYCLSAHTALGKKSGFSEEQILEIRNVKASFNPKYDALSKFVADTTINRGKPDSKAVENLLAAGYNEANLVDIVIVIGDKVITNFLYSITKIPIDFPLAVALEAA